MIMTSLVLMMKLQAIVMMMTLVRKVIAQMMKMKRIHMSQMKISLTLLPAFYQRSLSMMS